MDWIVEPRLLAKGKVNVVREEQRSDLVLLLSPNDKNRPGPERLCAAQVIDASKLEAKKLDVRARLFSSDGARSVVLVAAMGKDGKEVASVRLDQGPENWGEVNDRLLLPAKVALSQIIVVCVAEGLQGHAGFDDVSIRELIDEKMAPPDSEAGSVPDGELLAVHVEIDADRVIRDIPVSLYGTNVEWIESGQGLWDSRFDRLAPGIVRAAQEAKVSLVRFPGGTFSDYYHWKDGTGPRQNRPSTVPLPGGKATKHWMGTEEVFSFAGEIDAKVLLTVNAGTGSPNEAVEWQRYLKGRGLASRVSVWEIGNELYMKGDSSSSEKIALSPRAYAERFLQFARAMKEEDRSISLAAIGGWDSGRFPFLSDREWNKSALPIMADQMDYLAVHNAYAPLVVDDAGLDPIDVYRAMLAGSQQVRSNLEVLDRHLREYAGDKDGRIGLAITEWGPLYQVQPSGRFVDHVKTLGSALYVASTLGAFIDSPRTRVACFFKLSDGTFLGWVGRRQGELVATAPLLALQMFARHFGQKLVQDKTQSPTFDSPAIGILHAADDVPLVEVFASLDESGRRLYLMSINKSFHRAAKIHFDLGGFEPMPEAQAHRLSGTGVDAHTGTELPRIPGYPFARQAEVLPGRRFGQGGSKEVTITHQRVDGMSRSFEFEVPPLSVTSLELRRDPSRSSK
jgi:alpha-N-arabinofuranosidase